MGKVKKFIKENVVFVSLLSLIVFITIGLGTFYVLSQKNLGTILSELNDDKDSTKDEVKKNQTYVESFNGDFNSEDCVMLNWSIHENEKDKVIKVDLYHEKNLIANVTNLNSYQLMLNVYQYPTGKNNFSLNVYLENEKIVTKKLSVNIDEVFNTSFTSENVEGGVLVKINYKYGVNNDVGIPNINLSDFQGNTFDITYKETKVINQEGAYGEAFTSYFFDTTKLKPGTYDYNVRFIFKKVSLSFDSRVNVVVKDDTIKPEEKDETKDEGGENEAPTVPKDESVKEK
ncbi:MAG: hypothetical protein RR863_05630 [Erysipelotrichaceae bacterium]